MSILNKNILPINFLIKYKVMVKCIGTCILIGILGGIATMSSVHTWYPTLIKPNFTPPNWLFGPVWSLLYILMGYAWGLVLSNKNASLTSKQEIANLLFQLQLLLNGIWPFVFFAFQEIELAWLNLNLLCISLVMTIYYFYQVSKLAGCLLIPYFLWVSFANMLNGFIWYFNR